MCIVHRILSNPYIDIAILMRIPNQKCLGGYVVSTFWFIIERISFVKANKKQCTINRYYYLFHSAYNIQSNRTIAIAIFNAIAVRDIFAMISNSLLELNLYDEIYFDFPFALVSTNIFFQSHFVTSISISLSTYISHLIRSITQSTQNLSIDDVRWRNDSWMTIMHRFFSI